MRRRVAFLGMVLCAGLLIKEFLFPDRSAHWHSLGLFLYGVGTLMSIGYLILALRQKP